MNIDDEIVECIVMQEGTESHCVPGDRGGATSAGGITARHLRARTPGLGMEAAVARVMSMTLDEARRIIREDFVDPFRGIRPVLKGPLASCAMNMGQGRAVRILQRACNDAGAEPALAIDGIIGPKTRRAAHGLPPLELAEAFCREWHYRYWRIVKGDPSQSKFYGGWRNRVRFWLLRAREGRPSRLSAGAG